MRRSWLRRLLAIFPDRRAAVSPMLALMLIPLIGAMGMATEASGWFFMQRSAQNAADAAAMAAAINACDTAAACQTGTYADEARAVTARFGFTNGANNTTVTPIENVACPAPSALTNCYQVTITRLVPIALVRLLGYAGDATIGTAPAQTVRASAIASPRGSGRTYCLLAMAGQDGGPGGVGISSNGGSQFNPSGCYMFSDSSTSCTGAGNHPIAQYVDAHTTSYTNCVTSPANAVGGVPLVQDTAYRALAANIPANSCSPAGTASTYPQTNTSNQVTSAYVFTAVKVWCGNVNIVGTVVAATPAGGTVWVIENGSLNIPSGAVLRTGPGSGLTIIFTGPTISGLNPSHFPAVSNTGSVGGKLDIAAPGPGSGNWTGVALYQDPALPSGSGVNVTLSGSKEFYGITGLAYFPKSTVQLNGNVSQSTNGVACFALVVDTFSINGAPSIYTAAQSQCSSAGLTAPTGTVGAARQALVQ